MRLAMKMKEVHQDEDEWLENLLKWVFWL